jgi:hypothetical protein
VNQREKRKFVRDLTRGIRDNLLQRSKNWPRQWDGHELRAVVAEQARSAAVLSVIGKDSRLAPRRTREFWNAIKTKDITT